MKLVFPYIKLRSDFEMENNVGYISRVLKANGHIIESNNGNIIKSTMVILKISLYIMPTMTTY